MITIFPSVCTVYLGEDQRAVLDEHFSRLERANRDEDWPLVIGSAKELIETVAKFVIEVGGGELPEGRDGAQKLVPLMKAAEAVLSDVDEFDQLRLVGERARAMADAVGGLRNVSGTGHGRASPSVADEMYAFLALSSAAAWCAWILALFASLLRRSSQLLVADLESQTFRRGEVVARLVQLELSRLPAEDLRAIGRAMARRARRQTFVVRTEGLNDCVDSAPGQFPDEYRIGAMEGILLSNGRFEPDVELLRVGFEIMASSQNPHYVAQEVRSAVTATGFVPGLEIDLETKWGSKFRDAVPAGADGVVVDIWNGLPRLSMEQL